MTDQSNIQAQSVVKRAHATIPNEPAQAEEEQGIAYLTSKRNWHTCTHKMEEWILALRPCSGKVFFLKDGRIGMEQHGRVIVRSIELWMSQEQEAPILEDDEPFFATGFTLPPDIVGAIVNKKERKTEQKWDEMLNSPESHAFLDTLEEEALRDYREGRTEEGGFGKEQHA